MPSSKSSGKMTVESVEIGFDAANPINDSEPRSEPEAPVGSAWSLTTTEGSTGPLTGDLWEVGAANAVPAKEDNACTKEYLIFAAKVYSR